MSFLVHGPSKNGFIVNTLEREHTITHVLKLPIEIKGYVACTDTSRQGGDVPLRIAGM
jgi:hypothetical protein